MRAVVVGGGTMGVGIASVLARAGYDVDLVDADADAARRAVERARELINNGARRGVVAPALKTVARQRLRACADLAAVQAQPQLVVEAVPERLDLKRRLLAQAEQLEPALLATNTSGISIAELARDLRAPERFLGMHFFNPVPVMALVELVRGPRTGDQTVEDAVEVVRKLEKESIVVQDAPGFATSRLGVMLGLEAIRMVEQGVAQPDDIDRAMVLGYRHPIGPLRLTDLVGLDVRLDIARNLAAAYGPRFDPPKLLVEMVEAGRLGRKVGHGFYAWDEG